MKGAKKAVIAVRKSRQGSRNGSVALHPDVQEEQVMRRPPPRTSAAEAGR